MSGCFARRLLEPKKTSKDQYRLSTSTTKAMKAAFNRAVTEKNFKCGNELCWTTALPATCDGERWKIEEVVEDA